MKKDKKIIFGWSKKIDGNMRLFIDENNTIALKNRQKFLAKQGIESNKTIAIDLVHGKDIGRIYHQQPGIVPGLDGIVTGVPGIFLTITAADCLPIFIYDPVKRVVGLAHMGWRGAIAGVVPEIFRVLTGDYGCNPADIKISMGPHICVQCYEFSDEDAGPFHYIDDQRHGSCCVVRHGKFWLDLQNLLIVNWCIVVFCPRILPSVMSVPVVSQMTISHFVGINPGKSRPFWPTSASKNKALKAVKNRFFNTIDTIIIKCYNF
jgi:copper oxidase (laccase) domain-containing protein